MMQIISLGMGVQSTALYLMSSMGQIPRADYAIFADTGREGTATYQYLRFLLEWKEENKGIPILVCRDRNLYHDLLRTQDGRRFVSIPAFTRGENGTVGMLRRQCTTDYKVTVLDNCIRDRVYGLPKGSRRPQTAVWLGISLDEMDRMTIPQQVWKINTYPFLGKTVDKLGHIEALKWDSPINRQELTRWYLLHGLPVPAKSSCVFCPYQSDHSWAMRKRHAPEDFADAVRIDEAIRNSTAKGIRNPVYLHRSCRPLADVVFNLAEQQEWGECSGNCHV